MSKEKRIAIDLDGTICEELPAFSRCLAKPIDGVLEQVNELYNKAFIIIFTSRGWQEYDYTFKWLVDNGFKFDLLIMGKPIYNYIIDDRSEKSIKEFVERNKI